MNPLDDGTSPTSITRTPDDELLAALVQELETANDAQELLEAFVHRHPHIEVRLREAVFCALRFDIFLSRGHPFESNHVSDHSQTAHLDRWHEQGNVHFLYAAYSI